MLLKIGQLSRRSGVTIRALRHYDEIGLLSPSARSDGGFRLYGQADAGRLYRIQALCRLGLPLAEIRQVLDAGGAAFPDVLDQQIAALDRQISRSQALRARLAELQARCRDSETPGLDDWLGALAQMSAAARYFSSSELAALTPATDKAALGAALRRLMAEGVTPDSEAARDLAWRWMTLLLAEVGGDEGLLMKYYAMQWNEDALQALSGIDRAAMAWLAHAMAYRRLDIYAAYCSAGEMRTLRRHYVAHTTAWPPLIAALRRHMADGTDPGDPAPQALAAQWRTLDSAKTGGDAQLAAKLRLAFRREPAARLGSGIDESLLDYLDKVAGAAA